MWAGKFCMRNEDESVPPWRGGWNEVREMTKSLLTRELLGRFPFSFLFSFLMKEMELLLELSCGKQCHTKKSLTCQKGTKGNQRL